MSQQKARYEALRYFMGNSSKIKDAAQTGRNGGPNPSFPTKDGIIIMVEYSLSGGRRKFDSSVLSFRIVLKGT
jgi:hypothetical protein